MQATIQSLIEKVRIALDEILPEDEADGFTANADTEIAQALQTAIMQLSKEASPDMLEPKVLKGDLTPAQVKNDDGTGYIILPPDFLRLMELKLTSWSSSVWELMDPTSDEARRQASRWGRGTPQKPKAMESQDRAGNKILRYWTAGRFANNDGREVKAIYDHRIETFAYIGTPELSSDGSVIDCNLKDEAERSIIYRAAGIYLESKKEAELADRMYALSR